jgi:hypothetical protein
MLVSLARYHKSIAWFFVAVFYLELVLVPVAGRAETRPSLPYKPAPSYTSRSPWFLSAAGMSTPASGSNVAANPTQEVGVSSVPLTTHYSPLTTFTTGPGQPEMAAFTSVGSANMVDLFTGDFSYNIPLMDVGGYPVNLAYRAGVGMDDDASWVGLGWNVNPGTITRNMRGLPDDFNGVYDSVRKVQHIKENKTVGVTGGADLEIFGFPSKEKGGQKVDSPKTGVNIGASLGVVHNNYRGWGLEHSINASINAGKTGSGSLTAGLSITNSSMDGLSITPSLSAKLVQTDADQNKSTYGFSVTQPYNTRSGLRALQLGLGAGRSKTVKKNGESLSRGYYQGISSFISFNSPTYTPSITIPYTSYQISFSGKIGGAVKGFFADFFLSGYVAKQYIADADTLLELPSYGYLHYAAGAQNTASLLDFNREKEVPYREKPAIPHIAIPAYTYDAFSISGEGTGGMFRAYRSDIGFVYDHTIRTKDRSHRLGVDLGVGDLFHAGLDLNMNRVITENGPWINQNLLREATYFRTDSADFQAVYFRNPGEKSINDKRFYEKLGGDDVVTVGLSQPEGSNSGMIFATNYLRRYKNGRFNGFDTLNRRNAVKQERDKRTQVISYLTAKEAQTVGLSKYIEYHKMNAFHTDTCGEPKMEELAAIGSGLQAEYYSQKNFRGTPFPAIENVDFVWPWRKPPYVKAPNKALPGNFPWDYFTVRWVGRLKAPKTGNYKIYTTSDDGMRVFLNDTLIINKWSLNSKNEGEASVNLVAGKFYDIRVEYFEAGGDAYGWLWWQIPGKTSREIIQTTFLYPPPVKDTMDFNNVVREQRVNRFRKATHISEIDVLNNDGRRYIYGIPVYNLKQKEVTFAVNKDSGDRSTGLAKYVPGRENTAIGNHEGKDNYYSSEEVPSYAHSFLLTGILSADYSDITGNGISDDDIGDAVKFNYTKTAGIGNPYQWRTPSAERAAAYNEGLRTENRDDKGNYIFGEKELWYLHSIESKTMVATFILEDRDDLPAYGENGNKIASHATKRLREIRLYSKADFKTKQAAAIPVKTVHFKYSYRLCADAYGTGTGKLTLDTLYFTYNNNNKGKQNPYVFNYNSKNPAYHLQRNDRWGVYKDPMQNPGSVTGNVVTNAEYPYALHDSAAAAANAAAWALDSIQLPSGGALKVQYESDDYAFVQNKRAMQLFRVIGTAATPDFDKRSSKLYTKQIDNIWTDHRYVFIRVPKPVTDRRELYNTYLAGVEKLYFKLMVEMPSKPLDSGYEHIPVYANLDADSNYGIINSQVIWVKLAGISLAGDQPGPRSPLVKAATQFLRLNLPAKAYPGSETGDDLDLEEAVMMLAGMASSITSAFRSFDAIARNKPWGQNIDTLRSFVRLNSPFLKKMGGGHRVKRITVYDHWNKMAKKPGQPAVRPAVYGQEYIYTTPLQMDSSTIMGSSGVAIWEPGIGGEENPFRIPVEYVEKIAPLGPVTLGYTEEPLGESFFPGASVGYSRVRVRTINYKKTKSANGYEETRFYTAYDYPIYTDRTLIDGDNKKRYKPTLANLLRINAKHYMNLSQGFKIELNDMHGKMRSQASYAETDPIHPIAYSEQFYRTDTTIPGFRRLANTVMVMRPDGSIDTAALIGKDVELMMDMRMQRTVTQAFNLPLNWDYFTVPFVPPFFLFTTLYNFSQREENMFRSAATTKIIQRYGILDSAIQVDKGSRISTQDLMYDSETGDVLLTRTQNEFNDPVFNFTYPSHWAYDGMGLAYKNIDAVLRHVDIRDGKLVGMTPAQDSLFSSGDEILVAGKERTQDIPGCGKDSIATFPDFDKIWAVDSSVLYGGARGIYFIDRWGKAYTGYDISLRIIRSGRRNVLGAVGSVTSLDSLVKKNTTTGQYELVVNTNSKIIAASAGEFRQFWKTDDVLRKQPTITCIPNWQPDGTWECVQSSGVNTGYQRVQHKDINPHSPTYGDSTWVIVENCYACPRPGKWAQTDSFQCAQDSAGNNLGFRYRGEIDTASCSATYGQYRWQIAEAQNCTLCPKPANWQFTTGDSCQKDSNGINTGYILRKQTNIETCSSNPGAIRWIRDTVNCTMCSKPDEWWPLDSTRCEKDINGKNTGYLLRKEVNLQACNDSAVRWTKTLQCDSCKKPTSWQLAIGDSCQKIGGVNTGIRLKAYQNIEPCSDSAGMIKWVQYGAACDSCKRPPNWQYLRDSCVLDVNNKKTGIRLIGYQNTESCSDSFNVVKWISYGLDCINCKPPKAWKLVDSSCEVTGTKPFTYTGYMIRTYSDTSVCAGPDSTARVYRPQYCSQVEPEPEDTCVYVKVEIDTVYNTSNEKTAIIKLKFYSDVARTIPLALSNKKIRYHVENWEDGVWLNTTLYEVICTGTERTLGTHIQIYYLNQLESPNVLYEYKYGAPDELNPCESGGGGT